MFEAWPVETLMLRLFVLLAAGAAGAWCADQLRAPRLAGGLLAGVMLGPLLAATAPTWHEKLFLGAEAEHRALIAAEQEYAQGLDALRSTDITQVAIDEFEASWRPRLQRLREELQTQRTAHRQPLHALMLWGVAPLLLLGLSAQAAGPHRPRQLGAAFPAALGAPLLGGAAGLGAAWLLQAWGRAPDLPLWPLGAAMACAATAGPPIDPVRRALGNEHRNAHAAAVSGLAMVLTWAALAVAAAAAGSNVSDGAARMTAVALTLGGATAAWVLILLRGSSHALVDADRPARWRWPLVLGVGWAASTTGSLLYFAFAAVLSGLVVSLAQPARFSHTWLEIRRGALEPLLWAYAGWHFAFAGLDWAAVLLFAIAFCDCKALGALLVARATTPKPWPEAFALGTALAAGGSSPLIVALCLREAGWIDAPLYSALLIALLAGALCAGPMIGWMLKGEATTISDRDPA